MDMMDFKETNVYGSLGFGTLTWWYDGPCHLYLMVWSYLCLLWLVVRGWLFFKLVTDVHVLDMKPLDIGCSMIMWY